MSFKPNRVKLLRGISNKSGKFCSELRRNIFHIDIKTLSVFALYSFYKLSDYYVLKINVCKQFFYFSRTERAVPVNSRQTEKHSRPVSMRHFYYITVVHFDKRTVIIKAVSEYNNICKIRQSRFKNITVYVAICKSTDLSSICRSGLKIYCYLSTLRYIICADKKRIVSVKLHNACSVSLSNRKKSVSPAECIHRFGTKYQKSLPHSKLSRIGKAVVRNKSLKRDTELFSYR